jgi:hypothetical protein
MLILRGTASLGRGLQSRRGVDESQTKIGCTAIIVIAFALLSYGRAHEVSSIIAFGRVLDAIVTTGIIGNLIIAIVNWKSPDLPLSEAIPTVKYQRRSRPGCFASLNDMLVAFNLIRLVCVDLMTLNAAPRIFS